MANIYIIIYIYREKREGAREYIKKQKQYIRY